MKFSAYSKVSLDRESLRSSEISDAMSATVNQRMLHALIGIQTESSELLEAYMKADTWENHATTGLDVVNCIEEIGDMAFYINIALDVLDVDWEDLQKDFVGSDKGDLTLVHENICLGSELLDIVKRQLFYGSKFDNEKAVTHIKSLFNNLTVLIAVLGSNWEEVLDKNDRKLALRTGKKFNANSVINRATEKEREELEK